MKELTPEQVMQRLTSVIGIICHQPNNKMVPGVCDDCATEGDVWMRAATGHRGSLKIEALCASCMAKRQPAQPVTRG